jgi:hypothetical protein
MENLDEKNVPTSPEKWAQAKSQAKAKFDVYPSAYANGWAAKKYKAMGGGWKSVSEAKDEQEYGYEGDMALNQLATLTRCADMIKELLKPDTDMPEWVQSKITLATDYIQTAADYMYSEMKEEVDLDEADTLLARTGMNSAHKFPRSGQTNLGNIPAMNTPGNSKETDAYAEKRRGDRAKQLKPAIKAALGTHGPKSKLPEEVEQIEEMEIVKTATGMRVYGSSYGDSAKARRDQVKRPVDDVKGPKMKELSDIEAEKKKKKKMSEMVALYQEQGLKGLFASLVKEEPDNEQFTKELEAQKAKNAGQGKKAEVAKAAVQAVQEEEFEVVMDELNGYAEATIEERSMTEPEMKKKEEIVKSMKKGISGFKARYGDDAKSVMYATATKNAMKD